MLSKLILPAKIMRKKEFQNSNVGGKQIENLFVGAGFEINSTLMECEIFKRQKKKLQSITTKYFTCQY